MLVPLTHYLASGGSDNTWALWAVQQTLFIRAVVKLGEAPAHELEIPVCRMDQRRDGHFAIVRRDADTWQIEAAIFRSKAKDKQGHPIFLPRVTLLLKHAPEETNFRLAELL